MPRVGAAAKVDEATWRRSRQYQANTDQWSDLFDGGSEVKVKGGVSAPVSNSYSLETALKLYGLQLAAARDGECVEVSAADQEAVEKIEIDDAHRLLEQGPTIPLLTATEGLSLKSTESGVDADIPSRHNTAEDSDGEEMLLCCRCRLPLGQVAYVEHCYAGTCDAERQAMHGECMAQTIVHTHKDEEDDRVAKEIAMKETRRRDYDIGWKADSIPSNAGPASKLTCRPISHGMCCLVQDGLQSVRVAATADPSKSVNLEYFSLALQVRRGEGREPFFSLDPVGTGDDPEAAMQVKRFEPGWLAGTSVGEVLFQADYHLKELSMGECGQPVVGMKSCLDWAADGDFEKEWMAREWFVVKDACVQLAEENTLIAQVQMGVEAREQIWGASGCTEDAHMTRADHPLVKYAEEFTRNFNLIAERKSVVYHLRDLAKATILAKFVVEAGVRLDETWFTLAAAGQKNCLKEVPQLWNLRGDSQVRLQDGEIKEADKTISKNLRGLYGGVQFGLDRFTVNARAAAAVGRSATPSVSAGLRAPIASRVLMGTTGRALLTSVTRPPTMRAVVAPQGVDLNLDAFSLSARTATHHSKGPAIQPLDACIAMGTEFWQSLDKAADSAFQQEDKRLLRDLFNPNLSDRRDEGGRFVPPDTNPSYVKELRGLLVAEEYLRVQRKECFLSSSFKRHEPAALFPSSWTPSFKVTRRRALDGVLSDCLHPRPDLKQASVLVSALKSASPVFDQRAEDGSRYRIYRIGSLEIRTTQDQASEETIGAVFSIGTLSPNSQDGAIHEDERISKVTEFIEGIQSHALVASQALSRRSYVVLETEQGSTIMTEKLEDGTITWEENATRLDERNAAAKVIRVADCLDGKMTVGAMKKFGTRKAGRCGSVSKCRSYAQSMYGRACGGEVDLSGFRQPGQGSQWLKWKESATRTS